MRKILTLGISASLVFVGLTGCSPAALAEPITLEAACDEMYEASLNVPLGKFEATSEYMSEYADGVGKFAVYLDETIPGLRKTDESAADEFQVMSDAAKVVIDYADKAASSKEIDEDQFRVVLTDFFDEAEPVNELCRTK